MQRTIAGRYFIESPLGQGGMGSVYRALQLGLDRKVAIKILEVEGADANARFQREAKMVARVNHPNVVRIIDYGIDGGEAFIAMEFVEGISLESVVMSAQVLSAERLVEIAASVCEALHAAHSMGVVHRDVKPANIMLRGGLDGSVVLLDFGIARAEQELDAKITRAGVVMGTAAYMSPEQTRGERVDGRADVYSLACTLFELTTGRPPFLAPNPADVLGAHLYRDPPRLETLLEHPLPQALIDVIMRGLSKNPTARCENALEYAALLRESLIEKPKRGTEVSHRSAPSAQPSSNAVPQAASVFLAGIDAAESSNLLNALAMGNISSKGDLEAQVHFVVVPQQGNAIEIARARAQQFPKIPLILALTHFDPQILAEVIAAGVFDVLKWPAEPTKVLAKIVSAARKRSR
jgi:eukaryotic-like serine/threonine-protein kinase